MEIVIATKNKKKLEEIREIWKGLGLRLISLDELPKTPRVVENGKTFQENAIKKAVTLARFTGKLTMGEDSGLCVEALGGKPGVYSSRFSGKDKSDQKNNQKVLQLLGDLPPGKRRAHYISAIAFADAQGVIGVVEGRCDGLIGFEPKGTFGFGYDPLFVIPRYKKTFAQLGSRIKHSMSHRFRALEKAKKLLKRYIEERKGRSTKYFCS